MRVVADSHILLFYLFTLARLSDVALTEPFPVAGPGGSGDTPRVRR